MGCLQTSISYPTPENDRQAIASGKVPILDARHAIRYLHAPQTAATTKCSLPDARHTIIYNEMDVFFYDHLLLFIIIIIIIPIFLSRMHAFCLPYHN